MKTATVSKTYEISTDGRTVWVNGPEGCVARFSKRGMEVPAPECAGGQLSRASGTLQDWKYFQEALQRMGIKIDDSFQPAGLTE